MKNTTKILLGIIVALAVLLWFKSCNGGKGELIKVKVPEVKNEFEKQEPIYITKTDTVYITKWKTKDKIIHVETENPVNDSLAIAYQKAVDSLDRYKLYLSAIQIRDFKTTFDDEFLNLEITGKVQGELKYLKPSYTIKEREIASEVRQKDVVFRFLVGAQLQNSFEFDQFSWNVNAGLQNKKGNIIRAGYSKINGQEYLMLGYDLSVFSIKR